MNPKARFEPKIIIHGAGNVARRLTRFCHRKRWPIVACFSRAGSKLGQDIGRLAGLEEDLGVEVRDFAAADLVGIDADVALIATTDMLELNFPVYERYLSAGINVLCHGAQSYNPRFENPAIAEQIDQLARAGEVTFTGSGIWDTTRLWSAIIAAGTCLEIDSVVHTAQAEIGRQGARFEAEIGVGMTPEDYCAKYAAEPNSLSTFLHGPSVMVLQTLGCRITDVRKRAEPIVFDVDVFSPYTKTHFPAGIVIGTRIVADVTTAEGINGKTAVEYRLFRPGEIEELRWQINGMPGLQINVVRDDTANLSAASLFNRIPDVLAAPPGIVEITKMGPLKSSVLR